MKEIKIVIDRDILEEYYIYYFKKYNRRKLRKIKSPIPPSLNEILTANRHVGNSIKQAWGDFGEWLIYKNNLQDMNISKCSVYVEYTFSTKKARDLDNVTLKGLFDSWVSTNFIVDDNYFVITSLTFTGKYEKGVARTIITVKYEED